jgi:hypothetical protein
MDSLNMLFQDWICIVISILIGLTLAGMWGWFLTRETRPATGFLALYGLIVITAAGLGMISLMWGGRAYFMAHRTEANNEVAQEREREVMSTPDLDEDLVEKIRAEREEKEKQRRLEEERRKTREARQKSDEYLKSLENKGEEEK